MTRLRQRMIEDMQVRGLSPRTQESSVREVSQLALHYGKSPDLLTDEDLRQYFLYLRNEKPASRSSCTVALCAIKFLFERTLQRPWPLLELVRPPQAHPLPVVLSPDEVWQILAQIHLPHYQVCLSIIYTCGLRRSSGVGLRVAQIDSARMQRHIQGGKGHKDRYVPLLNADDDRVRAAGKPHHVARGAAARQWRHRAWAVGTHRPPFAPASRPRMGAARPAASAADRDGRLRRGGAAPSTHTGSTRSTTQWPGHDGCPTCGRWYGVWWAGCRRSPEAEGPAVQMPA